MNKEKFHDNCIHCKKMDIFVDIVPLVVNFTEISNI